EETHAIVQNLLQERIKIVDIGELMGRLTLNIVARALFSSDVKEHAPMIRRELERAQKLGAVLLRTPLPLYGAVPYLPVFRDIVRAANRLRAIVAQLIHRRRLSGDRPGDLLD